MTPFLRDSVTGQGRCPRMMLRIGFALSLGAAALAARWVSQGRMEPSIAPSRESLELVALSQKIAQGFDPVALIRRGQIFRRRGARLLADRDWSEAIELATESPSQAPVRRRAHRLRGQLRAEMGDQAGALEDFRQAWWPNGLWPD